MTTITLDVALRPYQKYPYAVRGLVLRADTHPEFREALSKGLHAVWVDLVSRVCVRDPGQPLKVRVSAVAEELALSQKTVQRAIKTFLKAQWLTFAPGHDGRDDFGRYSYREFVLGHTARSKLGLTPYPYPSDAINTPGAQAVAPSLHETAMSDGAGDNMAITSPAAQEYIDSGQKCPMAYTVNKDLKKDLKKIYVEKLEEPKQKGREVQDPISIPEALQPLVELGVYAATVCNLRKAARLAGQRLEDIWGACWEYVMHSAITGGRLVKYLTALIAKRDNYQGRAEQVARVSELTGWTPCMGVGEGSQWVAPPLYMRLDTTQQHARYANKKYRHKTGVVVKPYQDGTGDCISPSGKVRPIVPRDMLAVYADIEKGVLVEIVE